MTVNGDLPDNERERDDNTGGAWLVQALGLVVLLAAGALVFSGIRTSRAEVMASTSSQGLFSAGSVELDQTGQAVRLLFDQEGLYPGSQVEACVEVVYQGSIPAEVRLHGSSSGGTGLDDYMQFTVWTTRQTCPSSDTPTDIVANREPLFDNRLSDLWQSHGSYDDGVPLAQLEAGEQITLIARAELGDDDAAAGLYTDFSLVVEGRP